MQNGYTVCHSRKPLHREPFLTYQVLSQCMRIATQHLPSSISSLSLCMIRDKRVPAWWQSIDNIASILLVRRATITITDPYLCGLNGSRLGQAVCGRIFPDITCFWHVDDLWRCPLLFSAPIMWTFSRLITTNAFQERPWPPGRKVIWHGDLRTLGLGPDILWESHCCIFHS